MPTISAFPASFLFTERFANWFHEISAKMLRKHTKILENTPGKAKHSCDVKQLLSSSVAFFLQNWQLYHWNPPFVKVSIIRNFCKHLYQLHFWMLRFPKTNLGDFQTKRCFKLSFEINCFNIHQCHFWNLSHAVSSLNIDFYFLLLKSTKIKGVLACVL